MSFPRKITSALAWVGLGIVVAVPAIEMVSSKFVSKSAAEVAPVAEVEAPAPPVASEAVPAEAAPVAVPKATVVVKPAIPATPVAEAKPAVVVPAAPAPQVAEQAPAAADAPSGGDAVKDYLAANKTLPSYITSSSPAKTADTATVQPDAMTPAAQKLASTLSSEPSANQTAASTSPAASVSADSPDTAIATADAPVVTPAPVPMPVSSRPKVTPAQTVTEADLKDWKSGTLEDYLRQHNLLANSSPDQVSGN